MSWSETDDIELQEYIVRLQVKQKELQSQLIPIDIIINNVKQIQTRETKSYTDKREQKIIKILPKDKWGNEMTDEYRLEVKNECLAKMNELLGEPDE